MRQLPFQKALGLGMPKTFIQALANKAAQQGPHQDWYFQFFGGQDASDSGCLLRFSRCFQSHVMVFDWTGVVEHERVLPFARHGLVWHLGTSLLPSTHDRRAAQQCHYISGVWCVWIPGSQSARATLTSCHCGVAIGVCWGTEKSFSPKGRKSMNSTFV